MRATACLLPVHPLPSSGTLPGPPRRARSEARGTRMEGDYNSPCKQLTILLLPPRPKRPEEKTLPLYRAEKLPLREVLPAGAVRRSQVSVAAVSWGRKEVPEPDGANRSLVPGRRAGPELGFRCCCSSLCFCCWTCSWAFAGICQSCDPFADSRTSCWGRWSVTLALRGSPRRKSARGVCRASGRTGTPMRRSRVPQIAPHSPRS